MFNNKEALPIINESILDNNGIYDTTAIANHLNNYFANVDNKLAQTYAEQDEQLFLKFLSKQFSNSIFLEPTFPTEVVNILHVLNSNKSPVVDGISSYFVKIAADFLTISMLCTLSFLNGIFPECMKSAKVVPLFKSRSRFELINYRPISLLSCLSKVV